MCMGGSAPQGNTRARDMLMDGDHPMPGGPVEVYYGDGGQSVVPPGAARQGNQMQPGSGLVEVGYDDAGWLPPGYNPYAQEGTLNYPPLTPDEMKGDATAALQHRAEMAMAMQGMTPASPAYGEFQQSIRGNDNSLAQMLMGYRRPPMPQPTPRPR